MDKRRTKSLDGKCGSCRFFTVEPGQECIGYCSGRMKKKGRIMRTYKCIGYEAAPTIIQAEAGELSKRTNHETIRACSIEELAFYISRKFEDSCPGRKKYTRGVCDPTTRKCEACWLAWLRQPEDDDEWDRWSEETEDAE